MKKVDQNAKEKDEAESLISGITEEKRICPEGNEFSREVTL